MIYKYSRHPQYLGFLLWSYGSFLLYVFADSILVPTGRIGFSASLPWVISALIIIYVAFIEDIKLSKKYPDKITEYRKSTSFFLSLPTNIIRFILKKLFPNTKSEALKVVLFYFLIIVGLSFIIILILSISHFFAYIFWT